MDEDWGDDLAPDGVEVRSVEQLTGGFANTAWRVTLPETFYAAYHELRPPEPEWRDRFQLLNLRELLSVLAHFGPTGDYVVRVRDVLDRFS